MTLVDRQATHLWKPRLHEIAAGLLLSADEAISFAALASHHGFTVLLGEMRSLDPVARTINLNPVRSPDSRIGRRANDELIAARTMNYDIAVVATGSGIDDHHIPGVMEHC